ncbi:MAG: hypothetical protein AB9835_12690 [Eubacteriales bacterium]
MIYISPAENGFHAECSSCRRELHISEDKIAETKHGVILLREAELCRCGQKSSRVDTLAVPHRRILTKLDELVTLLSRRELAEQEGAGIRERLDAKAPPFPVLMLLRKDGLSALRFLGIAAGIAAAFRGPAARHRRDSIPYRHHAWAVRFHANGQRDCGRA